MCPAEERRHPFSVFLPRLGAAGGCSKMALIKRQHVSTDCCVHEGEGEGEEEGGGRGE